MCEIRILLFYNVINSRFLLYAMKFSNVRAIVNKMFHKIIDKATNFDAEKLAELHEKSKNILPDFSLTY